MDAGNLATVPLPELASAMAQSGELVVRFRTELDAALHKRCVDVEAALARKLEVKVGAMGADGTVLQDPGTGSDN